MNSEDVAQWLDATFGEYGTDDETAPYYSILFGTSDNGSVGKSFHILYEESRALVRTLDLRAVGEVLIGQFEHVAAAERDDAVFLDSAAVRLGDVVAIVPPIIPPYLANLSRRAIDRTGLKVPGTTYVALELGTGRLIPTSPTLDLPADAADALAALAPPRRREEPPGSRSRSTPMSCASSASPRSHLRRTRRAAPCSSSPRGSSTSSGSAGSASRRSPASCGTPSYELRSAKAEETLDNLVELLRRPA